VVRTLSPADTVYAAIEQMAEHSVGALIVTEGDRVVGVVSERDYARKVILRGKSSKETLVGDIMTSDVVCSTLDAEIEDCMQVMTQNRIRHLPIIDRGKLTGIVSIGDLVKTLLSEQRRTIDELERYVSG